MRREYRRVKNEREELEKTLRRNREGGGRSRTGSGLTLWWRKFRAHRINPAIVGAAIIFNSRKCHDARWIIGLRCARGRRKQKGVGNHLWLLIHSPFLTISMTFSTPFIYGVRLVFK